MSYDTRARSWTRSPARRRLSPGSPSPSSTRWEACNGRAMTLLPLEHRSCTSASSSAGRAASSRHLSSRPTSGRAGATHSSSRRAASCLSTTSVLRREGPRTSFGTQRTCSDPPYDAEERGVIDGGWVALASRAGETELRAHITDRVPQGVVYTTFHHPVTGANVVTTEHSDWATNCPEYKVTAGRGPGTGACEERPGLGRTVGPGGLRRPGIALRSETMARPDLVRMANQIAANFRHHPEAKAAAEVADHIKMSWPLAHGRRASRDIATRRLRPTRGGGRRAAG